MDHPHARLATLDTMKRLVKAKAPSRWKFECYQKEQLAAHQLSKDLLLGCTPLSSGAMEALVQHRAVMHPHPTKDYADYWPSTYQSYSQVSIAPPSGVRVVIRI
jgi:hypothetical protein